MSRCQKKWVFRVELCFQLERKHEQSLLCLVFNTASHNMPPLQNASNGATFLISYINLHGIRSNDLQHSAALVKRSQWNFTFQLVISSCYSPVKYKCTVIAQHQWRLTVGTVLSSCILFAVFAHPLLLRCSPTTSPSSTQSLTPVAASSSFTPGDCTSRS